MNAVHDKIRKMIMGRRICVKFYIVDCFAQQKYQGNQLAVFLPEKDLSAEEMQQIALEMHFSEVSFICSGKQENGGYRVRIFTPDTEVPFAGHPTLGTAYIIWKYLEGEQTDRVILNLNAGAIPVTVDGDVLTMRQNPPVYGETVDKHILAQILSVDADQIRDDFPIQWVSTGLAAYLIPMVDAEAVKRCRVNHLRFEQFFLEHDKCSLLMFSVEGENRLKARVFMDDTGFLEDPATGSANGDLAGYLLKYDVLGSGKKLNYTVHQGAEARRPSVLHVQAEETDGIVTILVGGSACVVAEGTWG